MIYDGIYVISYLYFLISIGFFLSIYGYFSKYALKTITSLINYWILPSFIFISVLRVFHFADLYTIFIILFILVISRIIGALLGILYNKIMKISSSIYRVNLICSSFASGINIYLILCDTRNCFLSYLYETEYNSNTFIYNTPLENAYFYITINEIIGNIISSFFTHKLIKHNASEILYSKISINSLLNSEENLKEKVTRHPIFNMRIATFLISMGFCLINFQYYVFANYWNFKFFCFDVIKYVVSCLATMLMIKEGALLSRSYKNSVFSGLQGFKKIKFFLEPKILWICFNKIIILPLIGFFICYYFQSWKIIENKILGFILFLQFASPIDSEIYRISKKNSFIENEIRAIFFLQYFLSYFTLIIFITLFLNLSS